MLDDLLEKSGLTKRELATIFGVHKYTPSNWGSVGVPQYVIAYLDMVIENRELKEMNRLLVRKVL